MGNFEKKKITVIGLGNLGFNLCQVLSSKNNTLEIYGFDINKEKSTIAKDSNVITKELKSYIDSISEIEILILATPTSSIYEIFETIQDKLNANAIIIDLCSSKRAINEWSNILLPNNEVIGLYPFIKQDSILNNNWAVISYSNSKNKATELANNLIKEMEGLVVNVDMAEHDSFVALTEAMPIILASNLINLSNNSSSWKEIFRYFDDEFNKFSDPLGKDPVSLFSQISSNNDLVIEWVKLYINELVKFQRLLELNSEKEIAEIINKTWEDRLKIINNIDPSISSTENLIPSSSENILSLFIGSRAARFFSKSKEIDKDKYGFEKRI